MKNHIEKIDSMLIELINNKIKNKYLDAFMYRATNLGGASFILTFTIFLIVFGNANWRIIGIEALLALTISQFIVVSLKVLLNRERPYKILEHLHTFGIELRDYSFPSGHTTASFSLATTIALNIPRLSIVVFFLAIIIGLSRIYLGVHYPTDVLAGVLVGLAIPILTHFFLVDIVDGVASFIGIN